MQEAALLDKRSSKLKGFDLDAYIREGAFGYPVSDRKVRVRATFSRDAGMHLHESARRQCSTRRSCTGGCWGLATAPSRRAEGAAGRIRCHRRCTVETYNDGICNRRQSST